MPSGKSRSTRRTSGTRARIAACPAASVGHPRTSKPASSRISAHSARMSSSSSTWTTRCRVVPAWSRRCRPRLAPLGIQCAHARVLPCVAPPTLLVANCMQSECTLLGGRKSLCASLVQFLWRTAVLDPPPLDHRERDARRPVNAGLQRVLRACAAGRCLLRRLEEADDRARHRARSPWPRRVQRGCRPRRCRCDRERQSDGLTRRSLTSPSGHLS